MLYADDVSILYLYFIRSVVVTICHSARETFNVCEREPALLDMSINFSKSCCMRIGPRCDRTCTSIKSLSGRCLPWTTEM